MQWIICEQLIKLLNNEWSRGLMNYLLILYKYHFVAPWAILNESFHNQDISQVLNTELNIILYVQ